MFLHVVHRHFSLLTFVQLDNYVTNVVKNAVRYVVAEYLFHNWLTEEQAELLLQRDIDIFRAGMGKNPLSVDTALSGLTLVLVFCMCVRYRGVYLLEELRVCGGAC